MHCLLYTRALGGGTAFFSIIMNRLLSTDMVRFLSIITIISISYTMATAYLFADVTYYSDPNSDVSNYLAYGPLLIFFDYFRLAAGISPFDELITKHSIISGSFYVSFVVISNMLLFNMLIAAMSSTYAELSECKKFQCFRVRMADIILLESIMPNYLSTKLRVMYRRLKVTLHITQDDTVSYDIYLMEAKDCFQKSFSTATKNKK